MRGTGVEYRPDCDAPVPLVGTFLRDVAARIAGLGLYCCIAILTMSCSDSDPDLSPEGEDPGSTTSVASDVDSGDSDNDSGDSEDVVEAQ